MKIPTFMQYTWRHIKLFLQNSRTKNVLGVFLFFSITILILFSNFNPKQVLLKPDEVARRNIQSDINAVVVDTQQTELLKQQAADKVQKVYQEDNFALANTEKDINMFFAGLGEIIAGPAEKRDVDLQNLLIKTNIKKDLFQLQYTPARLSEYIQATSPQDIEKMRQSTLNIVRVLMGNPITDDTLPGIYEQAFGKISTLGYAPEARDVIKIIAINSMRANLIYNESATNKAIREATDAVQPVQKTVKAGEIIVREGDRVTAEQISILEQLGIQRSKSYPVTLAGTALFVLLTFWLVLEFLRRYYPQIYRNEMMMLLIALIFILILAITRFVTVIKIGNEPELHLLTGYLAPVAAGSMLIAILLDNRLAYFLTMIMALYVGLLTQGDQLFYAVTAFVGGTVGIFRVHRLTQTSDLAKSGLHIALANIVTIITLNLIGGELNPGAMMLSVLMGAANGIISAILMIGALPYLESGFSLTSMIKLLELSNPNHPLLRRLLLEAPGTYHHSLMVGNLAESTAEAVGANPLLVRVGALYHDVGKIRRPEYFVENQRGFENPHEKIAPALSALIITSHVKEGAELAREAHLPQTILDFIEQHHGTGLAKYFYSRALEEDPDGNINEDNFRYEGPKPQSKEVALVMLADSIEAAVRSLQDPTPQKINQMVRMIIRDKLNDAQLETADLTFKDLDTISMSFCKALEGMYHKRIEYPEIMVREFEKRREQDGDPDHQSAK
ncbi:MAG: HD family phosphohydrolase [Syntrophomonadaceae bacterium]|jgi:putative nucleotidyltransferase with HDIG domain